MRQRIILHYGLQSIETPGLLDERLECLIMHLINSLPCQVSSEALTVKNHDSTRANSAEATLLDPLLTSTVALTRLDAPLQLEQKLEQSSGFHYATRILF